MKKRHLFVFRFLSFNGFLPPVQERRFDLRSGRIEAVWTTVTDTESVSQKTSIRIYSYRELEDLLREAGFNEFEALVTGTGEPFEVGSPRLGLVARK